MSKKLKFFALLLLVAALLVALAPTSTPNTRVAKAQEKVQVTWFVGLGAGGQPPQLEAQNALVEEFNATIGEEKGIELVIVIAENTVAYDTLATLLASPEETPDIVGPVGIKGSNAFDGNWADLEPLAEAAGYDLSQFPQAQVDFYRVEGQGLIGLPFGVYPSFIYYNRDLFDAAGLPYPPQAFGEPYADGEPWDFNKVQELSMQLTLDANGNNAASPDFDAENIVQFGFVEQWSNFVRMATQFGAGSYADGTTAVMPAPWAEFANWYYSGIWDTHFIPSGSYQGSDLLAAGNPFSSGHVAMAQSHLWYTCCLGEVANWDIAVTPAYNDTITAPLHVDTFRILKGSQNPEAAFEVLSYMLGEGSLPLLAVYGSMPARPENQAAFFEGLNATYTQGVNWQVAIDSLNFPDVPSHEANMPNYTKAFERSEAFKTLLENTPGLDVDAEIDTLVADLQAIFDEVQ